MLNVSKSKLTRKMEVRDELQIENQRMNKLIEFTRDKVPLLGFELIGIEKNQIVDPLKAEKYYLIKKDECKTQIDPLPLKRMATIFSLILIEGDRCSLKRLVFLCSKVNVFSKDDIEGFIRFLKKEGYLEILKEEAEYFVVLGWRFNAEYDAKGLLDCIQGLCK
jgi:hypothetical protein